MQTISLKFPAHLGRLVETEAKRRRVSKSAVVRACVEEVLVNHRHTVQQLSCADLMGDLVGSQPGPTDASSNKQHLEKSLLKDHARGRADTH
ncbi:MAG: hypothetical protein FJ147_12780 [Deltaproteobacteria bacterium]|nr:hypothetical protein [Deltaproteobacteria bacterium]